MISSRDGADRPNTNAVRYPEARCCGNPHPFTALLHVNGDTSHCRYYSSASFHTSFAHKSSYPSHDCIHNKSGGSGSTLVRNDTGYCRLSRLQTPHLVRVLSDCISHQWIRLPLFCHARRGPRSLFRRPLHYKLQAGLFGYDIHQSEQLHQRCPGFHHFVQNAHATLPSGHTGGYQSVY